MSKGQKKASLRDLSRERPGYEETSKIRKYLETASDVEAAITYAALIEQELEHLLFYRLKIKDREIIDDLTADGGSLSTFYDKILLGHAIKLYGDEICHNLHIIRRIRNVFAHAVMRVKFSNPLIVKELSRLRLRPKLDRKWARSLKDIQSEKGDARINYFILCTDCNVHLILRYTALLNASLRYHKRKRAKKPSGLGFFGGSPISLLTGYPQSQTGDPNRESQPERAGAQNYLAVMSKMAEKK
jgi:hypothetical protein